MLIRRVFVNINQCGSDYIFERAFKTPLSRIVSPSSSICTVHITTERDPLLLMCTRRERQSTVSRDMIIYLSEAH